MYFSRIIQDAPDGEFNLHRFEGYSFLAFACINEQSRREAAFDAIKFRADREPRIVFLSPLGDPILAKKWTSALEMKDEQQTILKDVDWIGFVAIPALLGGSDKISLQFVLRPQERPGINGISEMFDKATNIMHDRINADVVTTGVKSEIIGILKAIWRSVAIGYLS
jgi:hypothetical protein